MSDIAKFHPYDPHVMPPHTPTAIEELKRAFDYDGLPHDLGLLFVFNNVAPGLDEHERRAALIWMQRKVEQWSKETAK